MAPTKQKKQKQKSIGVDFKKVKHKVGRKLLPAANDTKVEVKSKSIVLPGQSVAQDKDGLATNNRQQTLKELLSQLTHHNNNVRKDSLTGIKDLLTKHPKELTSNAVTLMEKLCPRMTDKDKRVRQALLELLRTTIYPGLPQVLMRPIIPIVMAYIFSGMTNLSTEIRMSAFGFLDAVLQSYPLLVAADYVNQIAQYFVEFLSKLGIAAQSGSQLQEVLDSLLHFLAAIKRRSRVVKMEGSTDVDNGAMLALHWYKSVVPESSSVNLEGNNKCDTGKNIFSLSIADSLVKALFSCWAECAPMVCSGQAPDRESMGCMIKACQALRIILLCIDPDLEQVSCNGTKSDETRLQLQNSTIDMQLFEGQVWIQQNLIPLFDRHLLSYFPIVAPPINLPKKVEETLVTLNISISEVVLDALISGDVQLCVEHDVLTRLLNYLEDILNGRMLLSLGLSSDSIEKSQTEMHMKSLISVIPLLIRRVCEERQIEILQGFTTVFQTSKPSSKLKHACISCIKEILQPLNLKGRKGDLTDIANIFVFQKLWLQALPKLLWELKDINPSSSLAILQVLHHIGRSAPKNSQLAEEYTALQTILIPFFCVPSPTKCHGERWLSGPFMKLPLECQLIAVDLLYYFESFSSSFLKALAYCLNSELQANLVVRCIQILQAAYCRGSISLSDYLSFLSTILLQKTSVQDVFAEKKDADSALMKSFQKHRLIVSVICSCLCQIGEGRLILHLLNPLICNHIGSSPSTIISYGLIKVIMVLATIGNAIMLPKSLFELLPPFLAGYLISIKKEKIFNLKDVITDRNSISYPCLCLLSKSVKLTELVIRQLCYPTTQGQCPYESVAALLELFKIHHVRNKVRVISEERSFLQRFEGDESMNLHHLEKKELSSLYADIVKAAAVAYKWNDTVDSDTL